MTFLNDSLIIVLPLETFSLLLGWSHVQFLVIFNQSHNLGILPSLHPLKAKHGKIFFLLLAKIVFYEPRD